MTAEAADVLRVAIAVIATLSLFLLTRSLVKHWAAFAGWGPLGRKVRRVGLAFDVVLAANAYAAADAARSDVAPAFRVVVLAVAILGVVLALTLPAGPRPAQPIDQEH